MKNIDHLPRQALPTPTSRFISRDPARLSRRNPLISRVCARSAQALSRTDCTGLHVNKIFSLTPLNTLILQKNTLHWTRFVFIRVHSWFLPCFSTFHFLKSLISRFSRFLFFRHIVVRLSCFPLIRAPTWRTFVGLFLGR